MLDTVEALAAGCFRRTVLFLPSWLGDHNLYNACTCFAAFADACKSGHADFCEGVVPLMPTPAAAEAAKAGVARLQQRCQERILQSFTSCREYFTVLSSNGRKQLLQADSIQQTSAELEAVRSSVQDMYKQLQELRRTLAATSGEEGAALASCAPVEQDQAELSALSELSKDAEDLEKLLQTLQELKPQLYTQLCPVGGAQEDDEEGDLWGC